MRSLWRSPSFAAVTVLTLSLGIGVNAVALSMVYEILIRPLPYAQPSKIVVLNQFFPAGSELGLSPADVQNWLPRLQTIESAAAYYTRDVTVRSGNRSTVVTAAFVTDRFFDVLGTPAQFGKAAAESAPPTAVLGIAAVGSLQLPKGAEALGHPLTTGQQAYVVRGIMPLEFAFPSEQISLWLPSSVLLTGTRPEDSGYSKLVARLKPGVTADQVHQDIDRILRELKSQNKATVSVVGDSVVSEIRPVLRVALVGALLLLFVACANVTTLSLGRAIARQRELGARLALGATGWQLARGVLLEAAVIAGAAAVLAILIAASLVKLFSHVATGVVPRLQLVAVNVDSLSLTAGITIVVTFCCAAIPMGHAARARYQPFLRLGPRAGRGWRQVRAALVITQITLSCVLLIGAALLGRTVVLLMKDDHGFDPSGTAEAKIVLSDVVLFNGQGRESFVSALLERVRALPGVTVAGLGNALPPRPPSITVGLRIIDAGRDELRFFRIASVTPGYLRALGATFVSGRDFEQSDAGSRTVILSASAARFYFPNDNAVDRDIYALPRIVGIAGRPRVIGVVRDIPYEGLDAPAAGVVYVPWEWRPMGTAYVVVRTTPGNVNRLADDIRRTISALDASVPIGEAQSLVDELEGSIATRLARVLPAVVPVRFRWQYL